MTPRIEIISFPGCPHAGEASRLVRDVAARLSPGSPVADVVMETEEAARATGFPGSPSVRVDGTDVEGRDGDPPSLACRIYEGGTGVPPEWMLEAAILRALRPRHFLFLCVGNSARSQMAEGIARSLAPEGVRVDSAGSVPTAVHPRAVRVLAEIGIDISGHRSKGVGSIDIPSVDAVVTLCAEEVCPVFPGKVPRLYWGLPDPVWIDGDEEEKTAAFRGVRDELRRRLGFLFRKGGGR